MSGITLSNSSRANLLSLQSTQSLLSRTSNRLSTGLSVAKPIDDAIKFFAADALTFNANKLTRATDSIQQASQTLEAAVNGLKSITKYVEQIQGVMSNLVNATTTAASNQNLSTYNRLLTQIDNLANSTSYQGINLINTSTFSLGVSFTGNVGTNDLSISAIRSDSAGLNFSTIANGLFFSFTSTIPSQSSRESLASIASVASTASRAVVNASPEVASQNSIESKASVGSQASIAATGLTPSQASTASTASVASVASRESVPQISTSVSVPSVGTTESVASAGSTASIASVAGATVSGVNSALITSTNLTVNNALATLAASQSVLGSANAIIAVRLEFTKSYISTLQAGAAQLTVADLNEESANLTSLQTQQSLGVISLSISAQAQQSLLRLF